MFLTPQYFVLKYFHLSVCLLVILKLHLFYLFFFFHLQLNFHLCHLFVLLVQLCKMLHQSSSWCGRACFRAQAKFGWQPSIAPKASARASTKHRAYSLETEQTRRTSWRSLASSASSGPQRRRAKVHLSTSLAGTAMLKSFDCSQSTARFLAAPPCRG